MHLLSVNLIKKNDDSHILAIKCIKKGGGSRNMKNKSSIMFFTFLMILIFMGSAAATDNSSQINSTNIELYSTLNNDSYSNSSVLNSTNTSENFNYTNDCCSVLIHVNDNYDIFSYRRDSSYAADLYFQNMNFYGKEAIKEYKTVNGYFYHTIITADGWITSTGGPDVPDLNIALENLAGSNFASGSISWGTIESATNILRQLGMGHFLIKSPDGTVGYTIFNGWTKNGLFKMGNNQYVSVPNGPGYYREGYVEPSVYSAVNLAVTDGWGVNRRNIITYQVIRDMDEYTSYIKVYASSTIYADNMVFNGRYISKYALPAAPNYASIGDVALRRSYVYFGYQSMIYMYSAILESYNTGGSLPGSSTVIPWKILTDLNAGPFTNEQVLNASIWVKDYVNIYKKLPEYVIINNMQVNMAAFLKLLVSTTLNINNNDLGAVTYLLTYAKSSAPRDEINSGNMGKEEYLKIAGDIKNYMDSSGKTPDYAYNTSLGPYFGFQNLVYTYSSILSYCAANQTLPANVTVNSWKKVTEIKANITQIVTAASWVENYVKTYNKLPDSVTINGNPVAMSSFIYLLNSAILSINQGNLNANITAYGYNGPYNPKDSMRSGDMAKSEYLKISGDVKNYMDSSGNVPDYAYNTSLGTYFGFQNMIYTYSKILSYYGTNLALPDKISINSFSGVQIAVVQNNPSQEGTSDDITLDQISQAAIWVKEYVNTKLSLPEYVTIGNNSINMSSFLELLTTAILNINNNLNNSIYNMAFANVANPRDSMLSGSMGKGEYLKIASDVKNYMDSSGNVPDYAYNTSLGTYFGFQNLVYTYSCIMSYYAANKVLPGNVNVVPWKIVTEIKVNSSQVVNAALWVQDYVNNYKKLPDNVNINGIPVSMPSFLYLLNSAVLSINEGNLNANLTASSYIGPSSPKDAMRSGNMGKAEYLKIANDVKAYMGSSGKTPDYAYNTGLGTYFGFQNLVYTYSEVLSYYASYQSLPGSIAVTPWKKATEIEFTSNQMAAAASWVQDYINNNNKLPDNVLINGIPVDMSSFLYILTEMTVNINSGNPTDNLTSYSFNGPSNPKDSMVSGNMGKAEYLKIASDVRNYMDSSGNTPDYAYNTSLGTYFAYQNMIYTYSKVISYYSSNHTLPASVGVNPWLKFKLNDVLAAVSTVKTFIESNNYLPNYVMINSTRVSMPSFLKLLTEATLNINSNSTGSWIYPSNAAAPANPKDNMQNGNMQLAEYLKIAGDVKSYMSSSGKTPDYAYNTSLGAYFGYQNMIYTYCLILDNYKATNVLPPSVSIKSWQDISTFVFSNDQVVHAASWVKKYIENNHQLPEIVQIDGKNVNIYTYFYLASSVVQNIYKGGPQYVRSGIFNAPTINRENIQYKNMELSKYLNIAEQVTNYMQQSGQAPAYAVL